MDVTPEGSIRLVKPLQPEKASSPMDVTPEGRDKLVKLLHWTKAPLGKPPSSVPVEALPTIFTSDKSKIAKCPRLEPPILRITSKSPALISPTIFKLVILSRLLLPILSGNVPALSNFIVICSVIKLSAA